MMVLVTDCLHAWYYCNFSKRVIKSPKLYFYDVGLADRLLDIDDPQDLFVHPMRGALVEKLVFLEILKYRLNQAKKSNIYFWRDSQGNEIDFMLEQSMNTCIAIEVKSGMTMQRQFFNNIIKWRQISNMNGENFVIYGGDIRFETEDGIILPWNLMHTVTW